MGVGLPIGGGIGGFVLLLLFSALTGQNPLDLITAGSPEQQATGTQGVRDDNPQAKLASVVLADTEQVWQQVFASKGRHYEPPTLVLFTDASQSGCGPAIGDRALLLPARSQGLSRPVVLPRSRPSIRRAR